jgi:hypothetical protein
MDVFPHGNLVKPTCSSVHAVGCMMVCQVDNHGQQHDAAALL